MISEANLRLGMSCRPPCRCDSAPDAAFDQYDIELPRTHSPYHSITLKEDLSQHFGKLEEGFFPHASKLESIIVMDAFSALQGRQTAVSYPLSILCEVSEDVCEPSAEQRTMH